MKLVNNRLFQVKQTRFWFTWNSSNFNGNVALRKHKPARENVCAQWLDTNCCKVLSQMCVSHLDPLFSSSSLLNFCGVFSIAEAAPCRAPHQSDWTDIERARELSDQASLISSKISRPQRVIPGLNPATPPAPPQATHATPSTTTSRPPPQNITEPMAGMTIQVLID